MTKNFRKIVCVDYTKLQDWALEELKQHCETLEVYTDYPDSDGEIIARIGDADAVLVSWHTQISEAIIEACPDMRYIGMCCSLYDDASANVAVSFAGEKGITVKGIRDYGDPGVIEFIVSELVRLLHGFGENQWKEMPLELTGRKIGIIGLGVTGALLAECLLPFGADLYYFSRTRKESWETRGVKYLELHDLLKETEIISLHLPKNTKILEEPEFKVFGAGKILINTSLGLPFGESSFKKWIGNPSNYAIFDGDGKKELDAGIEESGNIITATKSAGWSRETAHRLSEKVLANLREVLRASTN